MVVVAVVDVVSAARRIHWRWDGGFDPVGCALSRQRHPELGIQTKGFRLCVMDVLGVGLFVGGCDMLSRSSIVSLCMIMEQGSDLARRGFEGKIWLSCGDGLKVRYTCLYLQSRVIN